MLLAVRDWQTFWKTSAQTAKSLDVTPYISLCAQLSSQGREVSQGPEMKREPGPHCSACTAQERCSHAVGPRRLDIETGPHGLWKRQSAFRWVPGEFVWDIGLGWIKILRFVTMSVSSVTAMRSLYLHWLLDLLRDRCSGHLQEQPASALGLYPAYPSCLLLVFHGCWLRTWNSWVRDRGLVPHGTAKQHELCVGLGSSVPQEWHQGPRQMPRKQWTASQPAHTELFIASGKQAYTWAIADTTLRSGPSGEHSRTTFLANPLRTCRGTRHPWRRASAGTPRAQGFLELQSVHMSSQVKPTTPLQVRQRQLHLRELRYWNQTFQSIMPEILTD